MPKNVFETKNFLIICICCRMFRFYIIHLPLTRIRIVLIMSLINKYPVFVNMPSSHFKRISKASERVPVQVPNMFAFERNRHRVRIPNIYKKNDPSQHFKNTTTITVTFRKSLIFSARFRLGVSILLYCTCIQYKLVKNTSFYR